MDEEERRRLFKSLGSAIIGMIIFAFLVVLILSLLSSCSYSINQVHSEGTNSDLIDENQTTDPTIKFQNFPATLNRSLFLRQDASGA